MLPNDVSRCAGHLGTGPEFCTRRFTCARFLAPAGVRSPLTLSACGAGVDAYIHAESIGQADGAGNPVVASSDGVLSVSTLRTGGE